MSCRLVWCGPILKIAAIVSSDSFHCVLIGVCVTRSHSFFHSACCCAIALVICVLLCAEATANRSKSGPDFFQVRIERTKSSPGSAPTGQVILFPAELSPTEAQVQVITRSGRTVGREVLWAAQGDPLKILFDTSSGEKVYYVRLAEKGLPAPPRWSPNSGLILESRRRVNGSANNWSEALKLWNASTTVLGRSMEASIFSGILPHAPSRDFMVRFHGVFMAPSSGTYEFSTMSDDASFLLIDGRLVAQESASIKFRSGGDLYLSETLYGINAMLDELALYAGRALTDQQVLDHFRAGSVGCGPVPTPTPTATP